MSAYASQTIEFAEPVLLGPIEGMFWRIEEGMAGAFRVTVLLQLDGCIESSFLTVALQRLQQRHPKLRAGIAKGRKGRLHYQFEQPSQAIPFTITDHEGEELPWREETRRMLQSSFPSSGPFAAISVLRNRSRGCCTLLLTVHHAIADGMSGIMLLDDLLSEYAKAEENLELPPCPALPAVTVNRAKSSGGWRRRFRLVRRFMRLQREERRAQQTTLPESRHVPPQSQWMHWVFSREDTRKLVRLCRKEQTSISGVMVAATCCGLMDCLPVPEALFKCQFPFNIREVLEGPAGPVTPQDLGCFVSVMNEFYEVSQNPTFWDLARRAHGDIQRFLQQEGPSFGYNMAALAAHPLLLRSAPRVMSSSNKRVTLLATNYGVINIHDAYGSLRPRGCTLTFKNDGVGPSLILEALVMGQQLNLGLAADELEPAFWEQLRTAIRKHLDAALNNSNISPTSA